MSSLAPNQLQLYAATKKWNSALSNASNYYYGKDLDILTLIPGFVPTRLTKDLPREGKVFISVDKCVAGAFRALGKTEGTLGGNGHIMFAFKWSFFVYFPFVVDLIKAVKNLFRKKKPEEDQKT